MHITKSFFYVVLEKDGEVLHRGKEERSILHTIKIKDWALLVCTFQNSFMKERGKEGGK
jgi:hypothetical protein